LISLNHLAYKFNFLDYPNKRKIHGYPIPYIGGLSLGLFYTLNVFINKSEFQFLNLILMYSMIIVIVGLIDDKIDINPILKIFLQSITIYILISNGIYLSDLGTYDYIGTINLGNYGQIFSFLCCLLIINAFNYTDGIDGLLSTLFINIFIFFIIFCYISGNTSEAKFLFFFIIPVLIFLLFNFSIFNLPKIFLGDSGSNLLGYLTGFTMIFLYKKTLISPSLLIWPVALIIFEFLSTNILRILSKKNIFHSGNDHLHYQIKKIYNLDTLGINLIFNSINIILSLFGFSIYFLLGSLFSLVGFILVFLIYLLIKIFYIK
tara:strand:+ start:1104 stop:2060 length:957 start_codon:yes stop_codon:yes gene_type:complete